MKSNDKSSIPTTAVFDPLNLIELCEEIDQRCFNMIADKFPSIVNVEAIKSLREEIKKEIASLTCEIMNDWLEIQNRLGIEIVLGDRTIPSVNELANKLPSILTYPKHSGNTEQDKAEIRAYLINQVRWIADIWLQMAGQLLARFEHQGTEYKVRDSKSVILLPTEIEGIYKSWKYLHRLTLEYLQAKANLLHSFDENVSGSIAISFSHSNNLSLENADRAFKEGELHNGVLLLYALRETLVRTCQYHGDDLPIPLEVIRTTYLLSLAAEAGMPLPFVKDFLIQLTAQLEDFCSTCQLIPANFMYPCMRILRVVIEHLNQLLPDDQLRTRLIDIAIARMSSSKNVEQTA